MQRCANMLYICVNVGSEEIELKKKKKTSKNAQYWFVLRQLVSSEIKRKYARSYLGIVWSVLNPLLSMAILSMIFSTMFKRSIENFPIYYLTGIVLWNLFSAATTNAMGALVDNRQLLLRVKLSKKTFVLARVYSAVVNFGYTCIAYVLMLLVFRIQPSWYMLLLPIDVFFLIMFSLGMAYILAIMFVFFADIRHLYTVLLTLWMYMSAIFYPVDNVTGVMREVILWNPMFSYIEFARDCVLYRQVPELRSWITIIIWGVVVYIIGYSVFRKKENLVMQRI